MESKSEINRFFLDQNVRLRDENYTLIDSIGQFTSETENYVVNLLLKMNSSIENHQQKTPLDGGV